MSYNSKLTSLQRAPGVSSASLVLRPGFEHKFTSKYFSLHGQAWRALDPSTGVRISPGLPKPQFPPLFTELTFENWVTNCFKWFSNVFERLNPSSRVFETSSVSKYNTTFRLLLNCVCTRGEARGSSML